MRTLLQILVRYSNFLVFVLLEVVAFLLIVNNNSYPRSSVLSTSNRMVAWQMEQLNSIKQYFHLRAENEQLMAENAELRNELVQFWNEQEQLMEDSVQANNAYEYAHLQMTYIPARVIEVSRHSNHNYLTINKGLRDSIAVGMGVRSKDGAVGIICTVSEHFALVLPIIHIQTRVSCRLKENNHIGTLEWSGGSWKKAQLKDIATHVPVNIGDSIVTSGLTASFPADIPVGKVLHTDVKEGNSYYTIEVELATDFHKLTTVQIISNALADEQQSLQPETR